MSDNEDELDWRALVEYAGIEDVPRGQQDAFIRSARAEIQTQLRSALDQLRSAFPVEFGSIKAVRDPDDMSEVFSELLDLIPEDKRPLVRIPAGISEFLLLTHDTEASPDADFGLPVVGGDIHPTESSLVRIEMDYDEELDVIGQEMGFWVCLVNGSKKSKVAFGNVYYGDLEGKEAVAPVSESFEAFFVQWSEFMCQAFADANSQEEKKEALQNFYTQFEQ
ncbi:uncharacterized protein SPPG_07824 [Spizellomyces punctatus DAOM BR117]|uniref:Uncharacterized protein n=1 Tax=Spizellomyces punctatus (strain DAOM BR117) TaxID=645134 RepID=A0A0L0H8K2_SPIPD|nr:uncharacterized protein SPPG_07824 [Spizellomyces punctatus DAOM BR117]KNC97008.1 hypothetical protein SPPG_07824 [Spizellomyces punctatus DAOM BR117]|eukprot:XP_016605048.1 hypothetical protein SPPG_07824 [Spizellomyces punctatus DAOM BR117]